MFIAKFREQVFFTRWTAPLLTPEKEMEYFTVDLLISDMGSVNHLLEWYETNGIIVECDNDTVSFTIPPNLSSVDFDEAICTRTSDGLASVVYVLKPTFFESLLISGWQKCIAFGVVMNILRCRCFHTKPDKKEFKDYNKCWCQPQQLQVIPINFQKPVNQSTIYRNQQCWVVKHWRHAKKQRLRKRKSWTG